MPVIAAVHGFCLGGGVGLAGNADIVVAADDATFGLPEVDRGALGAATHLARLVPQPLMRAMVYTCRTVTARQLLEFGTVLEVVPPGELRGAARAVAETIAAKDPAVIRAAKQSLNGIDPMDVKRSYRIRRGPLWWAEQVPAVTRNIAEDRDPAIRLRMWSRDEFHPRQQSSSCKRHRNRRHAGRNPPGPLPGYQRPTAAPAHPHVPAEARSEHPADVLPPTASADRHSSATANPPQDRNPVC